MSFFKRYDFWIKVVAIVLLVLNILGDKFGFSVDSVLFMDISSALASILVVLGVIQVPTTAVKNKKGDNNMTTDVKQSLTKIKDEILMVMSSVKNEKITAIGSMIDEIVSELNETQEQPVEETIEDVVIEQPVASEGEAETELEAELIEEEIKDMEGIEPFSAIIEEELREDFEQSEEETKGASNVGEEGIAQVDEAVTTIKEKIKNLIIENLDSIIDEAL